MPTVGSVTEFRSLHALTIAMLQLQHEHPWDLSPAEARETQKRLSRLVETADRLRDIGTVAGVDVGFDNSNARTRAAVVVLTFPGL